MMPGEVVLESGGEQQARLNIVLKFFLVLDHFFLAENAPLHAMGKSSAAQKAAYFNGSDIAGSASAFLMFYIHVLNEYLESPSGCRPELLRFFLTHLFDSFFHLLEEENTIELYDNDSTPFVLPLLGIKIPKNGPRMSISKAGLRKVLAKDESGSIEIDLDNPGQYRLPGHRLSPSSQLLLSIDGLIEDPAASACIVELKEPDMERLLHEMHAAFKLIHAADARLGKRMGRMIPWYFPIATPDKRQIHNSFSISSLHGAIFLSESYRFLTLAEALVHEYYHNELWWAMTIGPFWKAADEPKLYSPWRTDPRPLVGVFHGIYVFTGLLEFFAGGERNPALQEHHAHFRTRRKGIYFQLRTAIAQVPMQKLEPYGKQIMDMLKDTAERHGKELGLISASLPKHQQEHWNRWIAEHPEFRNDVPAPVGVA